MPQLTDLLALSHVPRWGVVRHHRQQSVSDHSYRVAIIYVELCNRLSLPVTLDGLRWALVHDGAESRSGDIPGNFKNGSADVSLRSTINLREHEMCPWLAEVIVSPHDRAMVKAADLIEEIAFIEMEGYGHEADRGSVNSWRNLRRHCAANTWIDYITCERIISDIKNEEGRP